MVNVNGREWCGNALVFATQKEAEDNAHDLMMRWTSVTDSRADETDDPVNYRWIDNKLVRVERAFPPSEGLSGADEPVNGDDGPHFA
jgi:hypothetical protein